MSCSTLHTKKGFSKVLPRIIHECLQYKEQTIEYFRHRQILNLHKYACG